MLKKEPIKNIKLWLWLAFLFIVSVPWYLPVGSYEPIILGVPYWAWIVLFASLALSATVTYAIKKLWVSDESEENE